MSRALNTLRASAADTMENAVTSSSTAAPSRPRVELVLRNVADTAPEILVPEGCTAPEAETLREGETIRLVLRNAGLYTVIVFG